MTRKPTQPNVTKSDHTDQPLPNWTYRAILEQLHEGVIITTLNGSFRRMNQMAAELYGFASPQKFERHLPKLDSLFELREYPSKRLVPQTQWPIAQLRHGATSLQTELYVKRRDTGKELILEYTGSLIYDEHDIPEFAVLTLRDVTPQKQAEAEKTARAAMEQASLAKIAAEREYQAAFFESALDAIITIDHTGMITEFNPAAERIFGYKRSEVVGQEMASLIIPPQHRNAHRHGLAHHLKTDKAVILDKLIEISALRRDGSEFPVELLVTRIGNEEPAIFMGTLRDITQRKLDQEKLFEMSQLRHTADRLIEINRAKDEFIALASHQLRTPATGVKQYIAMLLQGYAGDISLDQRTMLQTAYDSNERQLDIINALLNVAQLDAGNVKLRLATCRLDLLLQDIIKEQTEVFHTRNQTIQLRLPSKPASTEVDIRLLRMVLENIIDNAGKYSPHGKAVEIGLQRKPRHFTITIKDHGVGINKADQAKLFQKFSRIDNAFTIDAQGSGLGLYWAKKIIDLHDGSVTINSKPRQGSTFTITLPR